MRGGDQYYVLVRKTEPKPIRIFMQDGVHDEWGGGPEMGDWWMSNQTMERALTFAGYDVKHEWGAGTHNGNQAEAIFPQAIEWLWRDWPAPVRAGASQNPVLQAVLKPGAEWHVVAEGCPADTSIVTDSRGRLFYRESKTLKPIAIRISGAPDRCQNTTMQAAGLIAFDGKDSFYMTNNSKHEITAAPLSSGKARIVARGVDATSITLSRNGDIYASSRNDGGNIWLIRKDGSKVVVASGLNEPTGIALSPDGLWMFVAQRNSRFGFSYRLKTDGTLDSGVPFYDFYIPAWADSSGAGSVWFDTTGLAYVATAAGVQIFDRNGRVAAILTLPNDARSKQPVFRRRTSSTPCMSPLPARSTQGSSTRLAPLPGCRITNFRPGVPDNLTDLHWQSCLINSSAMRALYNRP